jgi:hypothetical protein
MSDDACVNDLEAVGTFEGLRLCDQCLFVEARVTKVTAGMLHGLLPIRKLVAFRAIRNLGYVHESVNKPRRFENRFKAPAELIFEHLRQVSVAFPIAIFWLEHRDMQFSSAWREVMRNGVVEQSVGDFDQRAQAIDWTLLDIFAPFWAEYEMQLPFGSMWSDWVADLAAAADGLRKQSGSVHGEKSLSPIPE